MKTEIITKYDYKTIKTYDFPLTLKRKDTVIFDDYYFDVVEVILNIKENVIQIIINR